MKQKINIGFIGCGNISGIYIKGCKTFPILNIVACADLDLSRAEAKAQEFNIPQPCSVEALLANPDIDLVVNLTVPTAHAEVTLAAIDAGKHVQSEKPLAVTREDGQKILAAATKKGVLVGCAPDTVLGAGIQTCRKLLDDGWIGRPVAATAFMASRGTESWHPNPEFYYQVGGGPMFDMGPYYLSTLINLLGPVKRVTGSTKISFPERTITSPARFGEKIKVEVPTAVGGVLDFSNGVMATIMITFDVWDSQLPNIEIYGSEGTLSVPDPNLFDGPVKIKRAEDTQWREIPFTHRPDISRGIGVADLAYAILYNRPHRTNAKLAYHVLDLMHSFTEASQQGKHIELQSDCEQPAPLPLGLLLGELDR